MQHVHRLDKSKGYLVYLSPFGGQVEEKIRLEAPCAV